MQPLPVYSFDVFDTCITRMHAYPRDLFFDLGARLAPTRKDETERFRFAQRFQRARIRAEKLANWLARRAGHEHANIEDIYRQLRWFMRLDRTIAELVQVELALEEESLYPIDETVTKIRQLRASGCRILFISDMYIPADSLGPLLERLGVMVPSDGLYVSCDVGCSKHSGKLFAHVLKAEGITGAELVHTGDNAHADIRMAQLHGIQTVHFTPAHLTQREQIIAGKRIPRKAAASWQAAFSRRCRLAMPTPSTQEACHPLDEVISGAIVPLLLAYTQWILDDAKQRGISRLYFVARDGEVLHKIARALEPEDMDLRYLYGSRRAWIIPSIGCEGEEWHASVAKSGQARCAADIVAKFGLPDTDVLFIRNAMHLSDAQWTSPLAPKDMQTFLASLQAHADAWERVLAHVRKEGAMAIDYFRQEGLCDGTPWALVDVGWALSTQTALRRILTSFHESVCIQGYYLALAKNHFHESVAGDARAFIGQYGSYVSRRAIVVEHFFFPPTHAPTIRYERTESGVQPAFGTFDVNEQDLQYARRLHEAATTAAKLVASEEQLREQLRMHRTFMIDAAKSFISAPLPSEAVPTRGFQANADMGHRKRQAKPLTSPLHLANVGHVVLSALFGPNNAPAIPVTWFEGSIAISKGIARHAGRWLARLDAIRHG